MALVSEGQMISLPEVATNSAVACHLPLKPEVPAEVKAAREKARWEPIHLIPDGFRKLGACAEVVEMVEHGCWIDFRGNRSRYEVVEQYPFENEGLWERTCKEADRMESCEALTDPTAPVRKISSWVVVEKGDKIRVCIDLSTLINPHIPAWPFKLPNFDAAAELIRPGSYLAKFDFRDGFFALKLHEADAHLLGVRHPGSGRVKVCSRLPFGLSWSPVWFCKLTEEIANLLRARGVRCIIFVDDLLLVSDTRDECVEAMRVTREVFTELGVQWAPHKTDGPTQVLEFLGVQIDTREGHMCFRLPASKLLSTLAKIKAFSEREERGWCPAADLASLVGSLSWCTAVVQGGRVFMRNMHTALAPAFVDAHGCP